MPGKALAQCRLMTCNTHNPRKPLTGREKMYFENVNKILSQFELTSRNEGHHIEIQKAQPAERGRERKPGIAWATTAARDFNYQPLEALYNYIVHLYYELCISIMHSAFISGNCAFVICIEHLYAGGHLCAASI